MHTDTLRDRFYVIRSGKTAFFIVPKCVLAFVESDATQ
jgi:hypothetical protein